MSLIVSEKFDLKISKTQNDKSILDKRVRGHVIYLIIDRKYLREINYYTNYLPDPIDEGTLME